MWELAEPFSRINGLRELADGRLIIFDSREKTLQLIEPATGAARPISREGRGPGEFLTVNSLFPLPNDRTLLTDSGNRRFLRLGPDGAVLETIGLPDLIEGSPAAAEPSMMRELSSLSLILARGVDRLGRLYFQHLSLGRPGHPTPPADSAAVLRWTIGGATVDSVGWVGIEGSSVVWAPREAWQVAPDGRIIRAIPNPYRVIVVDSAGRGTAGAAVSYTPIRVQEADRAQVRNERAGRMSQMGQMMRAELGARGAVGSGGAAPSLPAIEFAETKPPFHGTEPVAVTPDGQIWVHRSRAFGDEVPNYDVFDSAGRLQRRVVLPARSRLVGFGARTVYVARLDDDDLEWLQKYARP
jgi:hypothetical protein